MRAACLLALAALATLVACDDTSDDPRPDATDAADATTADATTAADAAAPDAGPARPTLHVTEADRWLAEEMTADVPGVRLVVDADPLARLAAAAPPAAALAPDASGCAECYRVERADGGVTLTAGGPAGKAYAITHWLEAIGYRFLHPEHVDAPPSPGDGTATVGEYSPAMRERALHLHILHPIEGHYAMWQPGEASLDDARGIVRWLLRHRGNGLYWPGLDDIARDDVTHAAWAAHTGAIIAHAHRLGVRIGLGVQLFGMSNLQQAYDLLDREIADDIARQAAIDARLARIVTDPPFDGITLSFGEFIAADPAAFVAAADEAAEHVFEYLPDAEITAVIHVGDEPQLRVEYMGREMIYYFLVQFADPRIVPFVHTVMYYTLFDDAGGAYHHEDFGEHRAFLVERLRAGEPAAYFPETAYWVAFDVSVPVWLPLYARSRSRDVRLLSTGDHPPLDRHVLFSSGWEWGYWMGDLVTLRASYVGASDDWAAPLRDAFAPWGEAGAALVDAIEDMGDAQHRALIEQRLAAYLSGRDATIDFGDRVGVLAAPDRWSFDEVAAMASDDKAAFVAEVLEPLEAFAAEVDGIAARIDGITWPVASDRWLREARDGAAVTARRLEFVAALYRAALDADPTAALAAADAAYAAGAAAVARRHADLNHHDPARLVERGGNATIYQYGYLHHADTLCYWRRERVQAARLLEGSTAPVPGCAL